MRACRDAGAARHTGRLDSDDRARAPRIVRQFRWRGIRLSRGHVSRKHAPFPVWRLRIVRTIASAHSPFAKVLPELRTQGLMRTHPRAESQRTSARAPRRRRARCVWGWGLGREPASCKPGRRRLELAQALSFSRSWPGLRSRMPSNADPVRRCRCRFAGDLPSVQIPRFCRTPFEPLALELTPTHHVPNTSDQARANLVR